MTKRNLFEEISKGFEELKEERMMTNHHFIKDDTGNWHNTKTGFYLGTDRKTAVHKDMYDDGSWTMEEVIDHLMGLVNMALEVDDD